MSKRDWLGLACLIFVFLLSCVKWASLFDSNLPTARSLRRKYKRQRADLRRAMKGFKRWS